MTKLPVEVTRKDVVCLVGRAVDDVRFNVRFALGNLHSIRRGLLAETVLHDNGLTPTISIFTKVSQVSITANSRQ